MIEVLIDYNKFQQNGITTVPEGAAYSRHHGGGCEMIAENDLCCHARTAHRFLNPYPYSNHGV
ncbi:MAG: hypothetical protein U9N35_01355 [Euryarchaeota archaeon]|nr:hypothetical protein [Euryarchaeota archaeon]